MAWSIFIRIHITLCILRKCLKYTLMRKAGFYKTLLGYNQRTLPVATTIHKSWLFHLLLDSASLLSHKFLSKLVPARAPYIYIYSRKGMGILYFLERLHHFVASYDRVVIQKIYSNPNLNGKTPDYEWLWYLTYLGILMGMTMYIRL